MTFPTGPFVDFDVEVPRSEHPAESGGRRIPIETGETRTDHQVLVSIAQLLEESLAEWRHIRNAFERLSVDGSSGGEERLPSITVEDMAKGEPKLTTKSYADRPLTRGLIDEHLAAHAYAKRMAADLQMHQWEATAAMAANGWKLS